jgi:hypothetical protein
MYLLSLSFEPIVLFLMKVSIKLFLIASFLTITFLLTLMLLALLLPLLLPGNNTHVVLNNGIMYIYLTESLVNFGFLLTIVAGKIVLDGVVLFSLVHVRC